MYQLFTQCNRITEKPTFDEAERAAIAFAGQEMVDVIIYDPDQIPGHIDRWLVRAGQPFVQAAHTKVAA